MATLREEVRFATRYHRQNIDISCGWACAQIVINSDRNPDLLDQIALNILESPLWWTDPEDLATQLTTSTGQNFELFCCNSEEQISRRIVSTIHNKSFGVSACALVWGDAHWVAVYGCEIDKKFNGYLSPSDKSYNILAFYAHDPSPSRPYGLPPWTDIADPHADMDICGSGGQAGRANIRVSYEQWRKRWMTGVQEIPGWVGKFIGVTRAKANTGIACAMPSWPAGPIPAGPVLIPPATRPNADYTTAGIEAVNALQNEILNQVPVPSPWDRLLPDYEASWVEWVTPDVTGVPGFYYWLVEIQITDSKVRPVAVILDENYKMLETAAIPTGDNVLGRYDDLYDGLDVLTLLRTNLVNRYVEFRSPNDPPGTTVPDYLVEPNILDTLTSVWQHALHSESVYAPYYRITIGERDIYFRLDDPTFFNHIIQMPQGYRVNLFPYTGLYKGV